MTVRWTRNAALNLAGIAGFVAEDNPKAALAIVRRIKESVRKTARFPRIGRVAPECGDEDIREVLVGNYRVIYRLARKAIEILTVFEGHRLTPAEAGELEGEE